jgi:acyl carrier protein
MKTAPQKTCLLAAVCELVRKSAKIPPGVPVHEHSRLVEDLAIDSLDLIQMILQIQDHFEIVIDEDHVANFCRVGDLAAYLSEQEDSNGL